MRIGYVINVFPKLSETFIAVEMAELRCRGIEILAVSLRTPTETLRHPIIQSSGLLDRTIYPPNDPLAALREFKPDVLHAHFATEPTAAARDFARALDVPFTFTAHGYDIFRKPPPDFAARAADASAVVTVSHANAQYIQQQFNVPPVKVHVIPCGVNTDLFKAAAEEKKNDVPLVVCVARHVVVKNLNLLLRALSLLAEWKVTFRAVLIGDGPCHEELKELSRDLRLEKQVEFLGSATQDDVLPWLQRANVAVLSSQNEGMPVCLMEAAACGVPVVATAVGGIPELVRDGVTGFLTPPEPQPFAAALRRVLEQPDLARQMGAAARADAERRFSVTRQVDQLLAIWNNTRDGQSKS
jgi:colanic acid/amylovoran biosynthesis glycosyltransferase